MLATTLLRIARYATDAQPNGDSRDASAKNSLDINGRVKMVPITATHIATGRAPYSLTRGFEPTEKTAYMKAESTTATGPDICWKLKSALTDRMTAPRAARVSASISLAPIRSLRKIAERSTAT